MYLDYAHRSDFSVHRGRMTKSRKDKSIIGQEFVCSKQEFRSKINLESDKTQDETREGCKALLYIIKERRR